MMVYRLTKKRYQTDLSGAGAALYGGRWNNKGVKLLYTATSRALAMAELAVHLNLHNMPTDLYMSTIRVPDDSDYFKLEDMTPYPNWNAHPPSSITQAVGDSFVNAQKFLGMYVPSVVVKGDFNLIINPLHPQFNRVKWLNSEPFEFDSRLISNFD